MLLQKTHMCFNELDYVTVGTVMNSKGAKMEFL